MTREEEYFNKIWEESREKLTKGDIVPFEYVDEKLGELDYILTTVSLLKDQSVFPKDNILKIINSLMETDSGNYFYPFESLHITLAGCTQRYKEQSSITTERTRKIEKLCEQILLRQGSIEMDIRGINVLGSSLFFQVFEKGNKFSKIREELIEYLRHNGEDPFIYPEISHIHINAVKLLHNDPKRLGTIARKVESLRNAEVGRFVVDNVDLIISDRILSPTTKFIRKIPLS